MVRRKRKWIFRSLFIVGILLTLTFLLFQTNIYFKNDDFTTKVRFEGEDGDSGSLILKRNSETPSVLDWVSFDDGEQVKFFSSSIITERIEVDLPDVVEPGVYYFDVEATYLSGIIEKKTVKFRVI